MTNSLQPTLSWFLFHDQLFTAHVTSHPPSPDFYFMTNSLHHTWLPTHPLLNSISWPTLYNPPDFTPTFSLFLFDDQLFAAHLTSHPPSPDFMTNSLHHTWLPTHPLLNSISWPTLYNPPDFTPTFSLFLFDDQLFTAHLTSHPPSPDFMTNSLQPTLSWFLFHDQLFTAHVTSHPPSPDFYFMTNSLHHTWLPTHPLLNSISWPTLYNPPDFTPTFSLFLFDDQLFAAHLTSHPPSPDFMTNSLHHTWLPTHPLLNSISWPTLYNPPDFTPTFSLFLFDGPTLCSPPDFPPTLSWFHDQLFAAHLTSHPPSPDFMTNSLQPTLSWFLFHDQLFTAHSTSHPPSPDFYFMTSSLQPTWLHSISTAVPLFAYSLPCALATLLNGLVSLCSLCFDLLAHRPCKQVFHHGHRNSQMPMCQSVLCSAYSVIVIKEMVFTWSMLDQTHCVDWSQL